MLTPLNDLQFDVAIVGGGPAGLTAALYLARFLRSAVVFDAGNARAAIIPSSKNCPGFPEGIAGEDLLRRLRQQATQYGARIVHNPVDAIETRREGFEVSTSAAVVKAQFVILATGIVDMAPAIVSLRQGIAEGLVRLCPVCDGYEVVGKSIGVVGQERDALREALFLRRYSSDIFMLGNFPGDFGDRARQEAAAAGITIWDTVDDVALSAAGLEVSMADDVAPRQLDVLYSAMGCQVRSELALNIGADCDEQGFILVGRHLETSVPGLFAIGDVVKALNQIAVGFGHAATAASHIHNLLRKRDLFLPLG
jgi:thioredoxin reductase (NADPH)